MSGSVVDVRFALLQMYFTLGKKVTILFEDWETDSKKGNFTVPRVLIVYSCIAKIVRG